VRDEQTMGRTARCAVGERGVTSVGRALRTTCTALVAGAVGLLGATPAQAAPSTAPPPAPLLTVTLARADAASPAAGSVIANPPGSVCDSVTTPSDVCAPVPLPAGSVVTLTAIAGVRSAFVGWGGACAGSVSTCTVVMDRDQPVTALFSAVAPAASAAPVPTTPPLLSPMAP
jgi:hypothetical protein